MNRPTAFLSFAVIAGLLGACTPSTEPSVVPGSPDLTPDPSSPVGTPDPTAPTTETSVARAYFHLAGPQGSEGLVAVLRQIPETEVVARAAMNGLLGGPQGAELEASPAITSAVPAGTRLLGLSISNGVATVDLSREFEAGGGSRSAFGRLAQVVYTLTQFPSVRSVVFQVEGETVTVFGSEGIVIDGPLARGDFEDFLPAIFVDRPAWGAAIGNPATVTGTANVFEAQFLVTLFDASGRELFGGPVMATSGSGTRGTFEVTIPYDVDQAQWGTLRAWNASAMDGSPEDIRDYPVWLTPAG